MSAPPFGALTARLVVALTIMLGLPAGPALAEAQRPQRGDDSTTSTVEALPPGVVDEGAIVHSWALMPVVHDPAKGGNRPNLSYEVPAGSSIQDELTLYNFGTEQLTFRLYATDAFNNKDGSFDLLPGDKAPSDVGSWVSLPQPNITLPARSQATLPITIKVPQLAHPGDYAGAVLASSRAEGTGPDGKLIAIDRRTGPRIYLRVAGELTPGLTVERLKATYDSSLDPLGGRTTVVYTVANRGNVRMRGHQRVSVAGPFGVARRQAARSELPELLPGESVELRATLSGVVASGMAVARVHLEPEVVGSKQVGQRPASHRSFLPAVPFSILAVMIVVAMLRRAVRAARRRKLTARLALTEP